MLYFYLKESKELFETLALDDIQWLSKFNFVKKGKTGFVEDDGVESLPFFEDYEITYMQALLMKEYAKENTKGLNLQSETIDKFYNILNTSIEKRKTIEVLCS